MNERLTAKNPRLKLTTAAMAALACLGGEVQAQSNPLTVRAGQEFTYDSNLRRTPDGEISDLISTTTLGASIDQPFGRQRYLADLAVRANVFRDNDQFNNTGYNALLGMDWSALRDWAGTIRLTSTQSLARFEDFATDAFNDENLLRTNSLATTARYGLFSTWSLDATAGYRNYYYSQPRFSDRNYKLGYVSGGASYRPSDLVRLGGLIRYTDGTYPDALKGEGKGGFDRVDYELTGNIKLSGLSTVDGRIAYSVENHDVIPSRDYSGLTGSVAWIYEPTAKSRFNVRLTRETGNRGGTESGGNIASTDNLLTTRLSGGWRWAATSKIAATVDLSYSQENYDIVNRERVIGGTASTFDAGDGNTRNLAIGVTYDATRSLSFECSVSRLSRSAELREERNRNRFNYSATPGQLWRPVRPPVTPRRPRCPPSC